MIQSLTRTTTTTAAPVARGMVERIEWNSFPNFLFYYYSNVHSKSCEKVICVSTAYQCLNVPAKQNRLNHHYSYIHCAITRNGYEYIHLLSSDLLYQIRSGARHTSEQRRIKKSHTCECERAGPGRQTDTCGNLAVLLFHTAVEISS